jgi:hypothetical protein
MTVLVSITNNSDNHTLNGTLSEDNVNPENVKVLTKFEIGPRETEEVMIWGTRFITIVEQSSGE